MSNIHDQYLLISLLIIVLAMLPLYLRFEKKQMNTRHLVLIAILAAIDREIFFKLGCACCG